MYNPTTRLLTILELLQAHQQLSGADLAARLEIDRRTVRRYITMLQDLGLPIEATTGRYGGYRLRAGYKLPPLIFNEDEAVALTIGLLSARRLGLASAAPAIEGALAKVERVLPGAVRDRVSAIGEMVALDLTSAVRPAASPLVATLSTAAQQGQRVLLRYRSRDKRETERPFDPYAVVYHTGLWYTVGFCHLRAEARTFRLDRITLAQPAPGSSTFTRPTDFDALDFVRRTLATTPRTWTAVVTLFITPEAAIAHLPPAIAAFEEVSDGVLLRCTTDSPQWLARILASLECDFVVHEPPELREALRELGNRLLATAALNQTDAGGEHQAPRTTP
jgi:predicted DNA-binding transcriptional regulator YafY